MENQTIYLPLRPILQVFTFYIYLMKKKNCAILALCLSMATIGKAGGFLTNTNHNIAFNRNFARVGTIGIDGVYSNPAGVAFLSNGFHLSLNVQNVFQTREILSGINVPAFQGTPFYQPFKLNGGDENGMKFYKGKTSVPILPSFQAAYNFDKWGFQAGFATYGGGGKATFNEGLPSFERTIAMIPAMLTAQGLTTADKAAYSFSSYMDGQQFAFGLQLGATYKFNEHLSAYAGARFNYIYNKYQGNILDISANINGTDQNLFSFFETKAKGYEQLATLYTTKANEATTPEEKAAYLETAKKCEIGAEKMNKAKGQFKDKELDCTQRGWGITPVLGIDYKTGRWNFGARYEFTTKFNIENHTKRDDTHQFENGVNTPNDIPGILAVGAQYEILKNLRVMASMHYFFDKDARMDRNKQRYLSGNTREYLAGVEWDITPAITVSAGGQRTKYGLGDGKYLSDLSFVTSSYSLGFGAKVKVAKNMRLNVAYFFTNYEHFKKEYEAQMPTADGQAITVKNTDDFTRTNKVFGVGLDIDF